MSGDALKSAYQTAIERLRHSNTAQPPSRTSFTAETAAQRVVRLLAFWQCRTRPRAFDKRLLRKAFLSLTFGLLICFGHWLARGAVVAVQLRTNALEVPSKGDSLLLYEDGLDDFAISAGGRPRIKDNAYISYRASVEPGAEVSHGILATGWDFLRLPLPREKESRDVHFWRMLVLAALLLSVFSATILNSYFPD